MFPMISVCFISSCNKLVLSMSRYTSDTPHFNVILSMNIFSVSLCHVPRQILFCSLYVSSGASFVAKTQLAKYWSLPMTRGRSWYFFCLQHTSSISIDTMLQNRLGMCLCQMMTQPASSWSSQLMINTILSHLFQIHTICIFFLIAWSSVWSRRGRILILETNWILSTAHSECSISRVISIVFLRSIESK